ncbi:MAG: MFS transporter [Sulfobacillus sp.]
MAQNLRWLYMGRALRSFVTAFLTVIFPLYLAQSGYGASRIGLALALSGLMTLLLVAAVGPIGDRLGRRRVIIGLSVLAVAGGAAMASSASFLVVVLASGLGGVGRGGGAGSGGSWGPLFPAEQPLMAAAVRPEERTGAFGILSFIGVMAGAAGSLVAAVPAILVQSGMGWLPAYRVLFWVGAILAIGMVLVALGLREARPSAVETAAEPRQTLSFRQLLGRLAVTNGLNGLGFGFLGPMLTYWFYRRYGVGPAEIGLLYTIINLASAIPYLGSSRLTAYLGSAVRTITLTRAAGLVAMATMIFMPSFWWAGAAYTVRMMLNSLGMPARQSYVMGVAAERYRSRIAAYSSLPSQAGAIISPAIGGALMDSVIDIPIFGSVFFMGLNVITYYLAFRNVRPAGETGPAPGP